MEGSQEGTKLTEKAIRRFILSLVGKLGLDPYQYTFGQLVEIHKIYEREKQIDRACSAQSPEMLPKDEVDQKKVDDALERVKQEKSQYKVPAQSWRFDRTFSQDEQLFS